MPGDETNPKLQEDAVTPRRANQQEIAPILAHEPRTRFALSIVPHVRDEVCKLVGVVECGRARPMAVRDRFQNVDLAVLQKRQSAPVLESAQFISDAFTWHAL